MRWPGTWSWPARSSSGGARPFHEPRQPSDPDRNAFARYRGRFDLRSVPVTATLWLSADGRYLAYVNGHRLGRGPAASDADVREVDPYDVRAFLVPGANVVAVLVHSYGVDTAWYTRPSALADSQRGGGALYAHLALDEGVALSSPAEWRCLRATDWVSDTPLVNASLGFVEERDARREPVGWESEPFDDSAWARPEPCVPGAFALPGRTYFPVLRPRVVPRFHERDVTPLSCAVDEVIDTSPQIGDILAHAAADRPIPLERCEVRGAPWGASAPQPVRIRTTGGRAARLHLDFGQLVAARPRIEVDGAAGVVVDIATSESCDGDGRPVRDLWGTRHGHRFILREGPQSLERWDWVGFRHLFVTVRGAERPITLRSVVAVSSEDPAPRPGEFSCSDELLAGVWAAGARTISLVTTDLIHSDVAREHRQWVGDVQAALGAILFTAGDRPLVRQAFTQIAEAEPFAGFLPMYAPGDYRTVGTTIPDFTLRWLLGLDEYLQWSGDVSIVQTLYPVVLRSIRAFGPLVDECGLIGELPYWHFIDWAAVGREGTAGPINGLYLLALQATSRLAAAVGDTREAARLHRLWSRGRSAMRARLRTRSGLFGDSPAGPPFSQHTNALAILSGAAPARSLPRIAGAIGDLARLRVTETAVVPREDAAPDYDPERHLVAAQPGFMGFVLRALAVAKREDLALEIMRDRWGPMAQSGGTCWETWSGRHSRCHPWATAPTAELPRIVLGVAPLERGWTKLRIDPFLGDLDWARGRVPTPRGVVGVSWARDKGGTSIEVELPDGVVAELRGGELLEAGRHERGLVEPTP